MAQARALFKFSSREILGQFSRRGGPAVEYLDALRETYAKRVLLNTWVSSRANAGLMCALGKCLGSGRDVEAFGRIIEIVPALLSSYQSSSGSMPIHWAAANDLIRLLPKNLLTAEILRAPNNCDITPIHLAAINGHLGSIPLEFLADEALEQRDCAGYNALSSAAYHRKLHRFPVNLMTQRQVDAVTAEGRNTLYYAARQEQLAFIPARFFNEANLTTKAITGETAAGVAALNGQSVAIPTEFQHLCLAQASP